MNCQKTKVCLELGRKTKIFFLAILFFEIFGLAGRSEAAVYLDGSTSGCIDGSNNYDPASRSCSGGSDKVYISLESFNSGIMASATNYIRAGNYWRTSGDFRGALIIEGRDGTSGSPTVVKAYPGEEQLAVIATAADKFQYNPNPADSSGILSWDYYPNPAITIQSSYVTVSGLKTYGQVRFLAPSDVLVENCDIGGGGPSDDQGNPVTWNWGYNYTLRNNYVHHGTDTVDSDNNGSLVIIYHASGLIEKNTFEDGWGNCVHNKDGLGQAGRTTEIRNNFFKPSSYFSPIEGIRGFNQARETSNVLIHNNIFYNLASGYSVTFSPAVSNIVYNNTFINTDVDLVSLAGGQPVPLPVPLQSYNNLFYHSNTGDVFSQIYNASHLISNYNVHSGSAIWIYYYSEVANSLVNWQSYSDKDRSSIDANPNFVNPSGNTPVDFKRSSYFENFTGSPYGTKAGAYVTGNEVIGYVAPGLSDATPPAPPSNLQIQ